MKPLFILVHCLCNDAETTGRLSAGSSTTSILQNSPSCDWSLDLVNNNNKKNIGLRDEKSKADTLRYDLQRVAATVIDRCTAAGLGSLCTLTTTFSTTFGTTALKEVDLSSLLAELNSSNAFAKVLPRVHEFSWFYFFRSLRAARSMASTYCCPPRF